uniref:Apelin n=1 Tax=Callorhinchus milii TaxID=7868 RepID=A0A4W3HLR3_CALMI
EKCCYQMQGLLLLLLYYNLRPVALLSEGSALEDGGIRTYVRKAGRGSSHRQPPMKKYRRLRPRLSHKGPMPF